MSDKVDSRMALYMLGFVREGQAVKIGRGTDV